MINDSWDTEKNLLQRLKPVLLSKLPYVVQNDTVRRVKTADTQDIITVYGKLQITPVPSARKDRKTAEPLPKLVHTKQKPQKVDFVLLNCGPSKHSCDSNTKDALEFESPFVNKRDSISRDVSHYHTPPQVLPYSHGSIRSRKNGLGWRELEHLGLSWEGKYLTTQIHRNYQGPNPRQLFMHQLENELAKGKKKEKTPPTVYMAEYKYPDRYLNKDAVFEKQLTNHRSEDEGSKKLDLLLSISSIKYQEKLALSHLNSSIAAQEKQERRSREKCSREYLSKCKDLRAQISVNLLHKHNPEEYQRVYQKLINEIY
jgi:hypothetical protein